ncbi:MAG: SprB repeat-containing protein [Bacteroidales bacterium]|nr:SprB repeat-containing protein [Bacteroidales bacterium]MDD3664708.1 SprB repeat-containing protein [Bacteroidales bacterium]
MADKLKWIGFFGLICLVFGNSPAVAQSDCTTDVPFFEVDLTANPDGVWISPSVSRNGECCSGASVNCVEFRVELHPMAAGVVLEIVSGAVPSGSLYYQNSCSSPSSVGDSMCLAGVGPHYLIFCKNGANANEYRLTSFSRPNAGNDYSVSGGCGSQLNASGFETTSIIWNSIAPGNPGDYNAWLSCQSGCADPVLTPLGTLPDYIDFEVTGNPLNSCPVNLKDTIRVWFASAVQCTLSPQTPSVCADSSSVYLTALASGGNPPYSYLWSTGATSASVHAMPGSIWCLVSDQSVCEGVSDTVVVGINPSAITAHAGTDQLLCHNDTLADLSGTVQVATGGIWSGGNGVFVPDNHSLSTQYRFAEAEMELPVFQLILTTTGNGNCPAVSDTVEINRLTKPLTSNILHY